jgi:hypothetical protein
MIQITLHSCKEDVINLPKSKTSSLDASHELVASVRSVPILPNDR